MKNIVLIFVSVLLAFSSCKPSQEDAIELSAVPTNVDFTIEEKAGETNTYILTNNTTGTFLYNWDLGNGTSVSGETVEAYYPSKGDYEITLRAFNNGGFGTASKMVQVLEDDVAPCPSGGLMEFLSDCNELGWTLAPEAGAYWVGPDDATTWWSNPADDVNVRFCAFDDEWIFKSDGVMVYDTKGDLWAEDYMGHNFECVTDDQLTGDPAVWGPGTHTFLVSDDPIPQLTVVGLGAFMGLPKATNDGELTTPTATQITYDVIEMGTDANGKFMTLEVNFGPGLWRFKYVAQ